jgi:hypothetical protein
MRGALPSLKGRASGAPLHFVSQATPVAVQYMPATFPDCPYWHSGKAVSRQSVAAEQVVVHAAKTLLRFEQLKQVVPLAHGWPQAGTNVVQVPWRQVTPGDRSDLIVDPSSVVVGPVAHPQAG